MFVVAGSNPCPECGKCFFRAEVLKVHLRDVHENKGKLFICEICDKTSTSLNGLRRHMSVYHRHQPHAPVAPSHAILPE